MGNYHRSGRVNIKYLLECIDILNNPSNNHPEEYYYSHILGYLTMYLKGESRMQLVHNQEGGQVFSNFLKCANIHTIQCQLLSGLRKGINNSFNDTGIDMKKGGGVSALPVEIEEVTNSLFDQLDDYGLFAVRNGELKVGWKN